ncbi:BTAD domain-containing putative transcriptional regulator [Longispora sp. K20-0274]|uniref:BTAD domain-containing putative transcriptional regulator n=1 Tax=Longispora sp. K20-0274 TaxID=3088255 RepID=UPI00399B01D7
MGDVSMSDGFELRILGPLELVRDGVTVTVEGRKPRQLLATLALHHGRTVSVDHAVEVLWPDRPPRSAVANVHTYVSYLRGLLGEDRLHRQPPGYRLQLGPGELDAARFDAGDPGALGLWRGFPVENLPQSPLWAAEVDRLVERWRSVRQARAAADPAGSLEDLRALVDEDPLREDSWLLLMTALEATGRRAEALAAYARARRRLAEELGVEPGEALRSLHRSLLLRDEVPLLTGTDRLDGAATGVLRGLARLGLGPVPGWVVGALSDRTSWRSVLETLDTHRLVRGHGADALGQPRYALPVLVGLLAPDLPGAPDDDAAVRRVLGGYLALADRAARALPPSVFGPGVRVAERWPVPGADVLTADPVAWFTAERDGLLAAVGLAARAGYPDLAWELAHALVPWCDLVGRTTDWERAARAAHAACRRAGDLLGEAVTLRDLGQVHLYRDRYGAATEAFGRSRLLYARLGNPRGEAGACAGLGAVHRIRGELDAARDCLGRALAFYRADGDRHGQAYVHGALGAVALAGGDLPAAAAALDTGLRLAAEVDDTHRAAHLTHQLGVVRERSGDRAGARAAMLAALDRFAALGDAHGEAYCLTDLAGFDRVDGAVRRLTRAWEIFERIGDRRAQARTARRLGELHTNALAAAYTSEALRLQSTVDS